MLKEWTAHVLSQYTPGTNAYYIIISKSTLRYSYSLETMTLSLTVLVIGPIEHPLSALEESEWTILLLMNSSCSGSHPGAHAQAYSSWPLGSQGTVKGVLWSVLLKSVSSFFQALVIAFGCLWLFCFVCLTRMFSVVCLKMPCSDKVVTLMRATHLQVLVRPC